MSSQKDTLLTNELEKNQQICLGLKALVDSGFSHQSLSVVVDELCDKSDSLKNTFGTFS